MGLALFDFDGTITQRDSLFDFLAFSFGFRRCVIGAFVLAPMMVAYLLRRIPSWRAKESVFRRFFKGWDLVKFRKAAATYSKERIPCIVREEALRQIEWHRVRGNRMVVVSASPEDWLRPWCEGQNIEVIATRLEVHEGRLTGRIEGRNCQGIEKVRRIKEVIDLDKYERVYAYGDSRGDAEMLDLANERYYRWKRVT